MKAIIVLHSTQFEPSFPIPTATTPDVMQRTLDLFIERGGFDIAVVDVPPQLTGTPEKFLADVKAFTDEAAAEIANWDRK